MPFQPIVPTWLALNAANDTSPTYFTDLRTGYPVFAGGLNLGDYFDLTEAEANSLSYTSAGLPNVPSGLPLLHAGRYRRILVDSGANAANIQTGAVGFLALGKTLNSVAITGAGSGQTPGSYQIAGVGGGGTGATIQVVVGSAGTVTQRPTVTNKGAGYTGVPTFTMPTTAGSVATFAAQMLPDQNVVTDFSHGIGNSTTIAVPRCIFLNAITPGNYGYVQEAGIATVLNGATAAGLTGSIVNVDLTVTTGVVAAPGTQTQVPAFVGYALNAPLAANQYLVQLGLTEWID